MSYRTDIIDNIYDTVDDLLIAKKFDEVNQILESLDIDNMEVVYLLSYLTITLPAWKQLKYRATFFDKCKESFIKRKENVDELLNGLKYYGQSWAEKTK
jgi:hypothetical protein